MKSKNKINPATLLFIITVLFLLNSSLARAATITDADGTVLTFDKPFSRIISLYAAHTENLYSLGLDHGILGVTKSDDFPRQVLTKQKFSYREDAEKFIGAKPDLVLIRPMISRGYPGFVDKLRRAGITVVSLQPKSIAEIYDYWHILGELSGKEAAAADMVSHFKEKIKAINRQVKMQVPLVRKRVYFEAIHRKMKTFASTSMAMFVLKTAGGVNIATDAIQVRNTNIAEYGKERILSHAHEIDIFLAQVGRMNRVTIENIAHEPGFAAIKAVQNESIYLISEKIVSRPTLRMLQGIVEIRRMLYPDIIFNNSQSGQ